MRQVRLTLTESSSTWINGTAASLLGGHFRSVPISWVLTGSLEGATVGPGCNGAPSVVEEAPQGGAVLLV